MVERNETATLPERELEDGQEGMYLTFHLGREEYGLEIRHVREIIGIQEITAVPDMPGCVRGVINLRGRVIPLVDMRLRFGMGALEYGDRTCIIVVEMPEQTTGLIVDRVREVVYIPAEQVEPAPALVGGHRRFVRGIGKSGPDIRILVALESLLAEETGFETGNFGQA